MAKARFLCTRKSGVETFTVALEPYAEDVTPACTTCGKTSHKDFCVGGEGTDVDPSHEPVELKEGDTSFFKDLPYGSIVLSVLTPEAAAEFEVGKLTTIEFKLTP